MLSIRVAWKTGEAVAVDSVPNLQRRRRLSLVQILKLRPNFSSEEERPGDTDHAIP